VASSGPKIPQLPDDTWRARAACRDEDPEVLTPVEGEGEEDLRLLEARDRLCLGAPCPVLGECRGWALTTRQPTGIWGGQSTPQREELLRSRRRRSA
jgi:WhiB family redox-sensing transcriptional regulator